MQTTPPEAAQSSVTLMTAAQRGITLIETCVVFAVLAILATQVAPNLRSLIEGRRLEGAASRLATDLHYVRTEAVARNQRLRLSVQATAGGGCYMVHTGGAGACTCGDNGTAQCSGGAQAFKSVSFSAGDRISLRSNVGSMVFDPVHGTSSPAGTYRLIGSDQRAIHHVVNVMGRVRSCSPLAAMPGYSAC